MRWVFVLRGLHLTLLMGMVMRSIYKVNEVNRAKPSLTRPGSRKGGSVHWSVAQGLRDHFPVFILRYQRRVRS